MRFKDIIKSIPFLYKPIVTIIYRHSRRKQAKLYRDYGGEALRLFDECMEKNGYKYTLAFGSILGAIREHGFIKHDLDIDTFMWIEDFKPEIIDSLEKAGFTWFCNMSIENDKYGREDTFKYKGVSIDVFYLYPAIDKYPYCCDFVPFREKEKNKRFPRRVEIPVSKNRKRVPFETIEVYVPENAEEVCEFRYGPNYMTPDPNWHWESSYNAIKEWPEMIQSTQCIYNPRAK